MRDSNSQRVAPNTLSKSVDVRPAQVATWCGAARRPVLNVAGRSTFYGLMRPAEVARLTKAGCYLPERGWGTLTFGDSAPAPGKEWTDTGDVHEDRGRKGRSRRSVRPTPPTCAPPRTTWPRHWPTRRPAAWPTPFPPPPGTWPTPRWSTWPHRSAGRDLVVRVAAIPAAEGEREPVTLAVGALVLRAFRTELRLSRARPGLEVPAAHQAAQRQRRGQDPQPAPGHPPQP